MILVANNNGYKNIAIGTSTLGGATRSSDGDAFTAYYNIAIGHEAGKSVTTGASNVLLGSLAGDAITTKTGIIAYWFRSSWWYINYW